MHLLTMSPVTSPLIRSLLACSLLLTLPACATVDKWFGSDAAKPAATQPVSKARTKKIDPTLFSGYLVKYNDMQEYTTPSGGTRLGWVSPELKKGQYTAIMIDPVGFYPKLPLYSKVSKGRMLEAAQYLVKQAKQEIGRDLKVVDQPGPGVLRWDAAITGVKPAPHQASTDTRNLPVAGIFIDAAPTAADPGTVVYLESRLVDSQTQKVMAKSVRAGVGSAITDPSQRITMKEMQPVLDGWVRDARGFVQEHIK